MAEKTNAAVGAEDQLPMKKTGPTAMIAAAVGVVVIGGLIIFSLSGGESAPAKVKANEAAASATEGMTKEELQERQEHLKMTQAALLAAAADEEAEKKAAAQKQQAAQKPEPEPEHHAPTASAPKPAAAKKPVNTKKSMDGLDALGADITSALK